MQIIVSTLQKLPFARSLSNFCVLSFHVKLFVLEANDGKRCVISISGSSVHRRYTGTCVLESAKFFKLRRDAAVISSTKSARAISPGCMIQARYVIVVTSQPVVIPYSRFEVHALIKLSPLPHLRFLTLRPLPRPESDEHLSSTRLFRPVLFS